MEMEIINLTPHSINFFSTGYGVEETYPSAGVARVASKQGHQIDGPFFSAPIWGEVEGLPAPKEGTIYIVSALVAGRCIGRTDVFSPGTGPNDGAVRDEKGQIKAVTRFIQAPMA